MNLTLRTNREITSHQIHDLLATTSTLANVLLNTEDTFDREARTSVEATLIRACTRLDHILDDSARWKTPESDGHEVYRGIAAEIAKMQAHQVNLLGLQVFAAEFQQQAVIAGLEAGPQPAVTAEIPPTKKPKNAKRRKTS